MKQLILFIACLMALGANGQTPVNYEYHRTFSPYIKGKVKTPIVYAIMPQLGAYESPNGKCAYIFGDAVHREKGNPDNVHLCIYIFDNEAAYNLFLKFQKHFGEKGYMTKDEGQMVTDHWISMITYNMPGIKNDLAYYPLKN